MAGDAGPGAQVRRGARRVAAAALRGAVGASRARFALAWPEPIPQPWGVCVRVSAGCPDGSRHGSRPVGPGQLVPPGHANAQKGAGVAFRERPWSVQVATHIILQKNNACDVT